MGLAWRMPDSETSRGFFKFLPRDPQDEHTPPSAAEIRQLEDILLGENSSTDLSSGSELIRLRELQKDSILNDLSLCAIQALNGNNHLRCPPTPVLIQPRVADIIDRLLIAREKLFERLEG